MIIKLKHPDMRTMLIDSLKELSNKEIHLNKWANKKFKHALWDEFCLSSEILENIPFEHYPPEEQIGYSIYNIKEITPILYLINKINLIVNEIGWDKKDEDYLNSPLWAEMVDAADIAYQELMKNENIHNKIEAS